MMKIVIQIEKKADIFKIVREGDNIDKDFPLMDRINFAKKAIDLDTSWSNLNW